MTHILTDAALGAAPLAPHCAFDKRARALLTAATSLLPLLEIGRPVESEYLRDAMTAAIGGTDAEGAWDWKSAYDACEVAQILFLRRFGPAIFSRGGSRSRSLALIERVSALMPTHTRRSETSQALQQYSTPAAYRSWLSSLLRLALAKLCSNLLLVQACWRSRPNWQVLSLC